MTRTCKQCRDEKPLEEFPKTSNGYRRRLCKECYNQFARQWAAAHYHRQPKERRAIRQKDTKLKMLYGISLVERDELIERQGGKCVICELPLIEEFHIHVDHDHKTGRVRGVLCSKCNLALGHMGDDPARLRRAADYIKRGENDE